MARTAYQRCLSAAMKRSKSKSPGARLRGAHAACRGTRKRTTARRRTTRRRR